MSIWTEPSPSDWDRWEELIFKADNGSEPGDAARALGFGGSSTFKRSDPVRHAEILDKWREDRKEQDRQTVRDTLRDNIARAMEPTPILYKGEPTGYFEWAGPVALRAAELLGKDAGMFQERVELSGPEGGPMEVTNPDVAAAIDRLTSGIVRLAARAAERNAALNPHAGSQSPPGLPVGRVVGQVEPGRTAG